MPIFKLALGALAVFLLALGADSEAGWRCRQASCCYSCCYSYCAIDGWANPSCVPFVYRGCYDDPPPSIPGFDCYCCNGGQYAVDCGNGGCYPGTVCYVVSGSGIDQITCGYGDGGGCLGQGPSMGIPSWLYRMKCVKVSVDNDGKGESGTLEDAVQGDTVEVLVMDRSKYLHKKYHRKYK